MYDYGNARIAARRSRLLGSDALARLAHAGSADEMLLMLERFEDWAPVLRELGTLVRPARSGIELAIERHRSAALAALPGLFHPPVRALVEALVLPLDLQRVLEVLRRRRGGEPPEAIAASVSRGALLDGAALGALARAANPRVAVELLARAGVIAGQPRRAAARWDAGLEPAELESLLRAEFEAARIARLAGLPDRGTVAAIVEAEREADREVLAELRENGPEAAAELERARRLPRLDALERRGRRDPLGIGAVAGYVAAIEAQAIRVRAALAAVAGGWSAVRTGSWLAVRAA